MFARIVAATDFSEPAERASRLAVDLARAHGAELVLLHVFVELPLYAETPATTVAQVYDEQRRWVQDELDVRAKNAAAGNLRVRTRLETGSAPETIAAIAREESADLVVVGTHGRTGLDRVMLGSVAERVVRVAPCPVLVVRPRADAAAGTRAA